MADLETPPRSRRRRSPAPCSPARLTRYEIAEDSMRPTLSPGDWVLGLRRPAAPRGGDIVVLDSPDGPGSRSSNGSLPSPGMRSTPPTGRARSAPTRCGYSATTPAAGSVDSRHFGPVPRSSIKAKLIWRYQPLPLTRIGPPVELIALP